MLRDPQTRAAAAPTPPLSAATVLRAPLLTLARRTHPRRESWAAVARRIGSPSLPIAYSCLLLAVCGLWTLICARGWQVPPAGDLRTALGIEWRAPLTLEIHLGIFTALLLWMVAGWILCVRAVSRAQPALSTILAGVTLVAVPLLLLTGIYSDDVYLYHFYGRELVHYAANPFLTAPAAFEGDPHLKWVYWKWLPSAYGPLWLLMSAPLSAAAGDSIAAAVVAYRMAGLVAHLLAVALIYSAVRTLRPERAATAAAFYGLNPFVIFESVASAHNDAWVVAFLCGVVWATSRHRVALAGVLFGCAVMVKPFAILAAVPLASALCSKAAREHRVRRLGVAAVAATTTGAVLYLPFGAGDALLRNILANPATGTYMNSLWEWIAIQLGGWSGPLRYWIQGAWLDPIRVALLASSISVGALVSWRTGRLTAGLIVTWTGFSLSQAWVWPWYSLPVFAMAAFESPRAQRLAVALSLGGLLFYLAWPPPQQALAWLYHRRSLLLFGPALLVLAYEAIAVARRQLSLLAPTNAAAAGSPSARR